MNRLSEQTEEKLRGLFEAALKSFVLTIRSLRQIARLTPKLIKQELEREQRERRDAYRAVFEKSYSEEYRQQLAPDLLAFVKRFTGRMEQAIDESLAARKEGSKKLREVHRAHLDDADPELDELWARLPLPAQVHLHHLLEGFAPFAISIVGNLELPRSLLVSGVTAFEVALSGILHATLVAHPERHETQLSAREISEFASVDDALDAAAQKRVERILRGSPDEWRKEVHKLCHVQFQDIAWGDWAHFAECIQRRHSIVHANGRITREYLSSVAPALLDELEDASIGAPLPVDEDYLSRALNDLEVTGLTLGYAVWHKLVPESDDWAASLTQALADGLDSSPPPVASGLGLSLIQLLMGWIDRADEPSFLAHGLLLALLTCGVADPESIGRNEDYLSGLRETLNSEADLRPIWKAVALDLVEGRDKALEYLRQDTEIPPMAWWVAPLLTRIRSDPRFAEIAFEAGARWRPKGTDLESE